MPPDFVFFADAPAVAEHDLRVVVWGILAAGALALPGLIKSILDIVRFFRKDPPDHERFASSLDFQALRLKVDSLATRAELAAMRNDMHGLIERLGPVATRSEVHEIEGRIKDSEGDLKGLLSEIRNDLRGVRSEMTSLNARLGKLEGAYDASAARRPRS